MAVGQADPASSSILHAQQAFQGGPKRTLPAKFCQASPVSHVTRIDHAMVAADYEIARQTDAANI